MVIKLPENCICKVGNEIFYETNSFIFKLMANLTREDIELSIVSHIIWRNIVYLCESNSKMTCIKVYLTGNNSLIRSNKEILANELLKNQNGIPIPSNLYVIWKPTTYIDCIIISEWLDGCSLKQCLKTSFNLTLNFFLPEVFKHLNSLWGSKVILQMESFAQNTADERFFNNYGFSHDDCFAYLKQTQPKHLDKISQLWSLFKKSTPYYTNSNIINGDISGKDYIFTYNGLYCIDWESFSLGSPIIDLAGLYYSVAHFYINDYEKEKRIFDIIYKYHKFNINNFGFYFSERFIAAYLISDKLISKKRLEWNIERATQFLSGQMLFE